MLYFIKNHQGYLKIGHSRLNINMRLMSYKCHGAEIELLGITEGTTSLEKRLHNILIHKQLHLFSEWFKEDDLVYYLWDIIVNKKWKPKYYKNSGYDLYLHNARDIRDYINEQ